MQSGLSVLKRMLHFPFVTCTCIYNLFLSLQREVNYTFALIFSITICVFGNSFLYGYNIGDVNNPAGVSSFLMSRDCNTQWLLENWSWDQVLRMSAPLVWLTIPNSSIQCVINTYKSYKRKMNLTQSYDHYIHRKIQKAKWQHKSATKNFDYTMIADRFRSYDWLRTVSCCDDSHQTGVAKPVYGIPTFPLTTKAVLSKG